MSKYQKHFQKMVDDYADFFTEFKALHEKFLTDPETYQDEFNETGQKILRIIRRYENELCSRSENSGYGKFSENLSEKFWEMVRGYFPFIDTIAH